MNRKQHSSRGACGARHHSPGNVGSVTRAVYRTDKTPHAYLRHVGGVLYSRSFSLPQNRRATAAESAPAGDHPDFAIRYLESRFVAQLPSRFDNVIEPPDVGLRV